MSSGGLRGAVDTALDFVFYPKSSLPTFKMGVRNADGTFREETPAETQQRGEHEAVVLGIDNAWRTSWTGIAQLLIIASLAPALINLQGLLQSNYLTYATIALAGAGFVATLLTMGRDGRRALKLLVMGITSFTLIGLSCAHHAGLISTQALRIGIYAVAGATGFKVILFYLQIAFEGQGRKLRDVQDNAVVDHNHSGEEEESRGSDGERNPNVNNNNNGGHISDSGETDGEQEGRQ